ncbi:MAG: hypothetical protein R3C13_01460 [Hyphomonas sp.]|uniref:hypothetical protein n=1 Tax=Hyphomonas sp. TaxID=87 RepID=UPI003529CFF2
MPITEVQSEAPKKRPMRQRRSRHTRKCLLVLGMHRSGTSALTRCLGLLGADLPLRLMPGGDSNSKGHWEPELIAQVNDHLLSELNSRWDDWQRLDLDALPPPLVAHYNSEIQKILREDYGTSKRFVLKDPRICRLAPLYLDILADMKVVPQIVLPFRNPVDAARSLNRRNGIDPCLAQLFWLRHICDSELASRGHPRVFVRYEALLSDWPEELNRVIKAFGLPKPDEHVSKEIDIFLDREMQSFDDGEAVMETDETVSGWTHRAFKALLALHADPDDAEAMQALDAARREFDILSDAVASHVRSLESERKAALHAAAAEAEHSHSLQARYDTLQQHHDDLRKYRDSLMSALETVKTVQADERQRLLAETAQSAADLASLRKDVQTRDQEHDRRISKLAADLAASHEQAQLKDLEHTQKIERLVADRDAAVAGLQDQLAAAARTHAQTVGELEASRADVAALQERLESLGSDKKALEADLLAARNKIQEFETSLQEAEESIRQTGLQAEMDRTALTDRFAAERDALVSSFTEQADETARQMQALTDTVSALSEQVRQVEQAAEAERMRFEQDSARLQSEAETARQQGRMLDQRISEMTQQVQQLTDERDSVLRSASWRLTAPFRKLVRLKLRFSESTHHREIEESGLFDASWYAASNPDVAASGLSPIVHYLRYGGHEGRDPSVHFRSADYLAKYPDVRASGLNPLVHFIRFGRQEDRSPIGRS